MKEVNEAFSAGIRAPKQIQSRLYNKELQPLNISQINYLLRGLREKTLSGSLSFEELTRSIDGCKNVPTSEDEAFVCSHFLDTSADKAKFQIFFSTKRVSS